MPIFENPDPCYTGSNPSIGGSLGILRARHLQSYTAERPPHPGCAGPPLQRMISDARQKEQSVPAGQVHLLWLTPPEN